MALLAESLAETPGNTPDGSPSSSPARGALTPASAHLAPETRAALIVDELRNAGVDLPAVHQAISTAIHGGPLRMSAPAVYIFFQHFPRLLHDDGIGSADYMALLNALAQAAPRARLAPSARYSPQPRSHAGQASTSAAAPRPEARGANTPLMARLEGSGIDMTRLANAIDRVWYIGASLPDDLRRVRNGPG